MQAQHDCNTTKTHAEHKEQLAQLSAQHQQSLAALQDQQKQMACDLSQQHDAELSNLQNQHQRQAIELSKQHNQIYAEQRSSDEAVQHCLQEKLEEAQRQMMEQHAQHEAELKGLTQQHEDRENELQLQLDTTLQVLFLGLALNYNAH